MRPAVGEKWQSHMKCRLSGAPRVHRMMPQGQVSGAAGDGSCHWVEDAKGTKMSCAVVLTGRIRSNEKVA